MVNRPPPAFAGPYTSGVLLIVPNRCLFGTHGYGNDPFGFIFSYPTDARYCRELCLETMS